MNCVIFQIVIFVIFIVEEHIAQVGLSSFLELFRRAPDSLHAFPFLKKLNHEDLEFYAQVLTSHWGKITLFVHKFT